jgi:hypothetical protein
MAFYFYPSNTTGYFNLAVSLICLGNVSKLPSRPASCACKVTNSLYKKLARVALWPPLLYTVDGRQMKYDIDSGQTVGPE